MRFPIPTPLDRCTVSVLFCSQLCLCLLVRLLFVLSHFALLTLLLFITIFSLISLLSLLANCMPGAGPVRIFTTRRNRGELVSRALLHKLI